MFLHATSLRFPYGLQNGWLRLTGGHGSHSEMARQTNDVLLKSYCAGEANSFDPLTCDGELYPAGEDDDDEDDDPAAAADGDCIPEGTSCFHTS